MTPPPNKETGSKTPDSSYWNAIELDGFYGLWRVHADAINGALLSRWLGGHGGAICVKTDAFEEAVGEGPLAMPGAAYQNCLYFDCAERILVQARKRHPALAAVVCDTRAIPLPECADAVVSFSTLDHFERRADFMQALAELHRILRPGGKLVITLDNPANPLVWFRNRIPRRFREGTGLVPYFVGYTVGAPGLGRVLEETGFLVRECTGVLHCPRVLAIPFCEFIQRRNPAMGRLLLRCLRAFEQCERLPTRYLSAHFVAALAEKPLGGQGRV